MTKISYIPYVSTHNHHEWFSSSVLAVILTGCWLGQASSSGDMVRMSNTSITSLNSGFTEDGIDVSEVAGTSGGVIGKSIEKLKDATSVSFHLC